MKRELLSKAFSGIDERFIMEAYRPVPEDAAGSPERIVHMRKKRILTLALAAALLLALGITAYAVWNIHTARQQELKADMQIEESHVTSYTEYDIPDGSGSGLVLLSSVNDGTEQHVFVNISPVTAEEAAAFPDNVRFIWQLEGTEVGGFAGPHLPVDTSVSGTEAIRDAVLNGAYDRETQTMTLHCYADVKMLEKAMAELGTESVPFQVQMLVGDNEPRVFGPVPLSLTEEQLRYFDFGHALYYDAELDREIEIVGLELTPFSAVWKVSYAEAAAFHTPEADPDAYGPWSILEDRVCMDAKIILSDGSAFSTGGALTCPYENGTVNLWCSWGRAVSIDDVQRIVLGDLVLWEAD